ncbi:MAG: CvpA family protein [Clostridia bacterium]|nr:CvpA family protein [Clostridia bacterium]
MEMYLGILIDVLLCLCIVLFVIRTAKKGFALSLFNIAAFFGAFLLASFVAKHLSGLIFSTFFEQTVIENIGNSAATVVNSTTEGIKNFVSTNFPLLFNFSTVSGIGLDTSAVQESSMATAGFISETLIEPLFVSLISFFVYIITLLISLPILRFIAKKLSKVFTVSLVGTINSVLGGVLGVVKGVVVVFVISTAILIITGLWLNGDSALAYGIQNSFIINFVSSIII